MEVPKGSEVVALTGASGFIAAHIAQQLLQAGYTVHGTVRDPDDEERTAFLKKIAADAGASDRLKLFKADLLDGSSFDAALADADYLLHTASPFLISKVSDPQKQLIEPAVQGTENALRAAMKAPKVKRVVVTSSCAAIYGNADDKNGVYTEEDWNRSSTLQEGAYSLSKRMAEEKAWELAKEQDKWDLVTINPALVVGPNLSGRPGASLELMTQLLDGTMRTGAPALNMGMVDVRDVAAAHICAMKHENAKGRYICAPETLDFVDMANAIAETHGQYPLPRSRAPKFLLYLVGPLMAGLSWHFIKHNVGHRLDFNNDKIKSELGFKFRPVGQALRDMADSLIEHGIVRKRDPKK